MLSVTGIVEVEFGEPHVRDDEGADAIVTWEPENVLRFQVAVAPVHVVQGLECFGETAELAKHPR